MTAPEIEDRQQRALEVARQLARDQIPVFIAPPCPESVNKCGFRLPPGWEETVPDPAVLDHWQPGWAVCAVTGHGLDLVDLDIYKNASAGDIMVPLMPYRYGVAATASGGAHAFVRSLGIRSRNEIAPGVDVKSGTPDGHGRGFAFIAPTIKPSKVTGEPAHYSWILEPDARAAREAVHDHTGRKLAEFIEKVRRGELPPIGITGAITGVPEGTPGVQAFMRPRVWSDIKGTLARGRNDGVMRLAAALRSQGGYSAEQALAYMYEYVWPEIDQGQAGHEFGRDEFEGIIRHAWRAWPDGAAARYQMAEAARDSVELDPAQSVMDLTDAYLAERVAKFALSDSVTGQPRMRWARGLGWYLWTGRVWVPVSDEYVRDQVTEFFRYWTGYTIERSAELNIEAGLLAKMASLMSKAKVSAVADLVQGYSSKAPGSLTECLHGVLTLKCVWCSVMIDPALFDAQPDLLNTPDGVVNLRTGEITQANAALLFTKMTAGNYKQGFTHPDWDKALLALDPPEQLWLRDRIGQGITGHSPTDGVMPVLQGSGENGKTLLTTDGPVRALGDYASMASAKLITAHKPGSSEHSTEMADLRGKRLLIGEELAEGRSIDVTALKRIMDVSKITARFVHRDNITFDATHTLLVTTNYIPVISETDHGTWRRLTLLRFPYTFRKRPQDCTRPEDRTGDPALKQRIRRNETGQYDAIVTWAVEGAIAWYRRRYADAPPTPRIEADTLDWRATADLILGFWREKLEPHAGSCILADEMRAQFTVWLGESGHKEWSRETFGSRFAGHDETTKHNVRSVRTRRPDGLVRWSLPGQFISDKSVQNGQHTVWRGVRPKTTGNAVTSDCAERAELTGKFSSEVSREKNREPYARSAQKPANDFETIPPEPESAPVTESPESSPPVTEAVVKSRAKRAERGAAKSRKPRDPDPGLTGALVVLPALVPADGRVLPCSPEQAVSAVGGPDLTVDVETTGYPPGHPHFALRTIQVGGAALAAVFDASDPVQCEAAGALLERAEILRAHSAAADLVPLAMAGLVSYDSAWRKMHDTVLPAKLADPAMTGSDADGLKALARDVLGGAACSPAADRARSQLFAKTGWATETGALTPPEKSGWAAVPLCEAYVRYGASDVLDTAAIAAVIPPPDPVIYERERAVERICSRVSYHGLALDGNRVRELIGRESSAREAARALTAGFGLENAGSPAQVAAAFESLAVRLPATPPSVKFPQGQPSTAEAVVSEIAREHAGTPPGELARAILDYREHATILALTLEPMRVLAELGDGRARPVIYTLEAATGRMSARRPNLQQIKREGGYRSCITADPGYCGISADFASVEVRVAAALSQDPNLMAMIAGGDAYADDPERKKDFDLHWLTARQVWGPGATKSQRYAVKRAVFGHLYGGSARAMANGAGIPLEMAHAVKESLQRLAPGLTAWDDQNRAAVRSGQTAFAACSGRTIWLDKRQAHKASNYCIQGTARELLADALLRWEATPWGGCVIMPVHDEIIAFVPESQAVEATQALVDCMTTSLYGVTIAAEASEPWTAWPDAS